MRFLLALLDEVLFRARRARKESAEYIRIVDRDGGVVLPCGCFISVRVDDLRFVLERTNPQSLNKLVRGFLEPGGHECRPPA